MPAQQTCIDAGLFTELNKRFYENLCEVSNVIPYTEQKKPFAWAKDSKLPPTELAEAYLAGTPFHSLFLMPVPLAVTHDTFFSHMHVCGGTGAGKTQWLSTLILHHLADPTAPAHVVVDSQSDLINKLSRLEALKDRGILITPKDIKYPPAINVFDIKQARLGSYDEVTREQVVAGAIDTFDYLFSGLVGADLTAKQSWRILLRTRRQSSSCPPSNANSLNVTSERRHSIRPKSKSAIASTPFSKIRRWSGSLPLRKPASISSKS